MRIFDISTDMAAAPVYPGDPATRFERVSSISKGDECNLTALSACLHTGTHIDAPAHYIDGAATIDKPAPPPPMGDCAVIACNSYFDDLTGADIEELLPPRATRVLFKTLGQCRLTRSAVFALIAAGVKLCGIDAPSIAAEDDEAHVHRELALAGVAVLEGLTLRHVQSGRYSLFALPVKMSGVEAAPCRAMLLDNR